MKISIIVALSENGVIGRDGEIPWRLSRDLRRFKKLTMGHHLIMGRKTFESIGRPLPGRENLILSRQRDYSPEGTKVFSTLEEAFEAARKEGEDEAFVIGGESIYALALPLAHRLYLTRVHTEIEGDTFFPTPNWSNWREIESREFLANKKNEYPSTFTIYDRKTPPSF